ncbi:30S ribosomal protein S27ae [archaeon]|nr:MAG: 30S ribosomal protein S27ae [archaeon]
MSNTIAKYYKIEGEKLIRLKRQCPRCGRFMAEHSNRWTCGYCGFTIFKKEEGP